MMMVVGLSQPANSKKDSPQTLAFAARQNSEKKDSPLPHHLMHRDEHDDHFLQLKHSADVSPLTSIPLAPTPRQESRSQ
jgi:hypothetical protein